MIKESGRPDYRLADYFDYVAGISNGGIIAAGIAVGLRVQEILDFYLKNGAAMFDKAGLFAPPAIQVQQRATRRETQAGLRRHDGAPELESLLLLIVRNATTDSPWPISNNPYAKYNHAEHSPCNLRFPLW